MKKTHEKLAIDGGPKAVERNNGHATLVWHPWSLLRFDPGMRMIDLVFRYVRDIRLPATTFAAHTKSV